MAESAIQDYRVSTEPYYLPVGREVALFEAAHAARLHKHSGTDRVVFGVMRVPRGQRRMERVGLVVHIGGGDQCEAVATIMRPNED